MRRYLRIATVSLVDNGSQDPPEHTKEAGGGTGERLKEVNGSSTQANEDKLMWRLDNGTYVGDRLPLVPQRMVDTLSCLPLTLKCDPLGPDKALALTLLA